MMLSSTEQSIQKITFDFLDKDKRSYTETNTKTIKRVDIMLQIYKHDQLYFYKKRMNMKA